MWMDFGCEELSEKRHEHFLFYNYYKEIESYRKLHSRQNLKNKVYFFYYTPSFEEIRASDT